MEKDKLIIKVYRADDSRNLAGTIRLTESAEIKLRQIQRETGFSVRALASMMIEYAAEHVEIIHEDGEEVSINALTQNENGAGRT